MAEYPIRLLAAGLAAVLVGGGLTALLGAESVSLTVANPDRSDSLHRALRIVKRAGGKVLSGPTLGGDLIHVFYSVPAGKLATVAAELRKTGTLESYRRSEFPAGDSRPGIIAEIAGVDAEIAGLNAATHPRAAADLAERKKKLEAERKQLDEAHAWAQVRFTLRTSTVGFTAGAPYDTGNSPWKKAPRILLSAEAEDNRLNKVPAFAECLASVLAAGGLRLDHSGPRDESVHAAADALARKAGPSTDYIIAAASRLQIAGGNPEAGRHSCIATAEVAVRSRERQGIYVTWAAGPISVSAKTRADACARAAARVATDLLSGFTRVGTLWERMPAPQKTAFLNRLSEVRRSSLPAP